VRKARRRRDNGDCFEAAVRVLQLLQRSPTHSGGCWLVHGEVAGQGRLEGVTFGHAWVEEELVVAAPLTLAGTVRVLVHDHSCGRSVKMDRELYYAIGHIAKIANVWRYSWEEARDKLLAHKTFGPWDLVTHSRL
jgi:hypothetical protein